MRAPWHFIVTLLIASALACGESHREPAAVGGRGGSPDEETAKAGRGAAGRAGESGSAGVAGADALMPSPVRIVVENNGREPISIGNFCGGRWTTILQRGIALDTNGYCKTTCDNPNVGGCPGICISTEKVLLPGQRDLFEWDGVVFDQTSGGCHMQNHPARGTGLTARACWNTALSSGADSSGTCTSMEFRYGDAAEIVLSTTSAQTNSGSTKFLLVNTNDQPIEIVAEKCGQQAVFQFDTGGQEAFAVFCGCACEGAMDSIHCVTPACGGCPEDVVKVLAPGSEFEFVWDKRFWHTAPNGCPIPYQLQEDGFVQMKACWREPPSMDAVCSKFAVSGSGSAVRVETREDR